MMPRLLNPQGIAGLAASAALLILLLLAKGDVRHWKKQSSQFEQLYRAEQMAHAGTVANYRAAAEKARAADQTHIALVTAEQRSINERTSNDFEARLADARARAERLRSEATSSAANPGTGRGAALPRVADTAGGIDEGAHQNRLPRDDALIATEQAIQLDELIKWVRRQASVDKGPRHEARSDP